MPAFNRVIERSVQGIASPPFTTPPSGSTQPIVSSSTIVWVIIGIGAFAFTAGLFRGQSWMALLTCEVPALDDTQEFIERTQDIAHSGPVIVVPRSIPTRLSGVTPNTLTDSSVSGNPSASLATLVPPLLGNTDITGNLRPTNQPHSPIPSPVYRVPRGRDRRTACELIRGSTASRWPHIF